MAQVSTLDTSSIAFYQNTIGGLVSLLDREAAIDASARQVTDANISKMNDVIGTCLDSMNLLLEPPA